MRIRKLQMLLAVAFLGMAVVAPVAAAQKGLTLPGGANGGVTGTEGTPSGDLRYETISTPGRTTLLATEVDGGELRRSRSLADDWVVPAVTLGGEAGGLSADGETLVLVHPIYELSANETRFLVLDDRLQIRQRVAIDGFVSFDAISPDGSTMYLVRYEDPRSPLEYEVRAYDLSAGKLVPGEIVDPQEPEEQMGGQPVDRAMSPDGRWAYTLYGGGEEAFIHAIDTEGRVAACIDLEEFRPNETFRLALEVAPASGAITVARRGSPLATVDPETFEVSSVSEAPPPLDADDSRDVLPLALAVGLVALVGIGLLIYRRRGRRRTEDAELERVFAASQTSETEREKEPEPVP